MPKKSRRSPADRVLEAIIGIIVVYISQYTSESVIQLIVVLFGLLIVVHAILSD